MKACAPPHCPVPRPDKGAERGAGLPLFASVKAGTLAHLIESFPTLAPDMSACVRVARVCAKRAGIGENAEQ